MKKFILLLIVSVFTFQTFAQEEEKVKDKPVRSPWESGYLIDNQTSFIPVAKTLEYVIQHKFGSVENGISDMFGLYSPGANVRLGLNYVAAKNFQIGIGATKKNMYTDLNAKWTILEQTRQNTVPVAVTLYGNVAIDGRNADQIGTGRVYDTKSILVSSSIAFKDRLSYFSQLIVGRKFTDWLTLQAALSFTHYNMVPFDWDHDKLAWHINGRIKVTPQGSIVFNYDHPMKIESLSEQLSPIENYARPNLAFGYEISTSTHAFQLYMGTSRSILPQENMMFNENEVEGNNFAIGMTITRLWNF